MSGCQIGPRAIWQFGNLKMMQFGNETIWKGRVDPFYCFLLLGPRIASAVKGSSGQWCLG